MYLLSGFWFPIARRKINEIQLKSPNWLFGQRKYEENVSSPKITSGEAINGESRDERGVDSFRNMYWISSDNDDHEESIFQRYLPMPSVDQANGWYGGSLRSDQDENREIHKHYAELCRGLMEPFQNDSELEKHYADALRMDIIDIINDATAEEEMEAALKEYDQIGADLGISPLSSKSFSGDSSWLTRWIIEEGNLQRTRDIAATFCF